jgi:hypothetical protein
VNGDEVMGGGEKYTIRSSTGRPRHRWVDNIKMDLRDII